MNWKSDVWSRRELHNESDTIADLIRKDAIDEIALYVAIIEWNK